MNLLSIILDFIFPTSKQVLELEQMSSEDLERFLPPSVTNISDTLVLFDYTNRYVRLWEVKYGSNKILIRSLGEILSRKIASYGTSPLKPLLIPVPISNRRRRERGYNQCERICVAMLEASPQDTLDYAPHILEKCIHTDSQTHTRHKKERLENITGSMRMRVGTQKTIHNRTIIVIDDVSTTGSTFKEVRRALYKGHPSRIICIAIAHSN